MYREFDRAYWEGLHSGHTAARPADPNPQLVAELARLSPGTALDAGCGRGAEACWLAARGWRVTAVDIATSALHRARERAEALGTEVAERITWWRADLTGRVPIAERFDLVTSHYVHAAGSREVLFDRLAAAVVPGGTLFVVGHHPSDAHSAARTSGPQVHFTAEEIAAGLDPRWWEIAVAETRTRSVLGHAERADHLEHTGDHGREGCGGDEGHGIVLRDTVLRARKRA